MEIENLKCVICDAKLIEIDVSSHRKDIYPSDNRYVGRLFNHVLKFRCVNGCDVVCNDDVALNLSNKFQNQDRCCVLKSKISGLLTKDQPDSFYEEIVKEICK